MRRLIFRITMISLFLLLLAIPLIGSSTAIAETISLHVWVSFSKMGEEVDRAVRIADWVYLNYEINDGNGNAFDPQDYGYNYSVTEYIYNTDGSTRHSCQYDNSRGNWIGVQYGWGSTTGTQSGKVVISGDISLECDVSWELFDTVPVINTQPTAQTVRYGNDAFFSIDASGSHLSYQWYYKNSYGTSYKLNGATGSTLTLSGNLEPYAGKYIYCVVSNYNQSVTSVAAQLTVQSTVSYNAYGGSVNITGKTVTYGDAYGTLPTPTRSGYTFDGWYSASSGGSRITSGTIVSTVSDHTIYARWIPGQYNVTFNANGGTVSSSGKVVTYGETYGTLPTPNRTDHTFDGWFTAASGGTQITSSSTVGETADHTLYAHWSYEPVSYTLSYNANGGSGAPADQDASILGGSASSGIDITISSTVPTRFGYDFLGWGTSSGSSVPSYYPRGTITLTGNRTLYAVWKSAALINRPSLPKAADVNMNIGGAARYLCIVSQYSGLHTMETSGGYDTYGVLFDSAGSQISSNDDGGDGNNFRISYSLEAGKSYYLRVTMYSSSSAPGYITTHFSAPTFTVAFDANGGTVSPASKPVTNFQSYGDLPIATRTGFQFDGWYTAAGSGTLVSASTTVNLTANQTLYAHWRTAGTYTVSFDANGGSGAPSSITAAVGTSITIPSTVPSRENHTFKGWALSRTATGAQYQPGDGYSGTDVTLYAVWSETSVGYDVTREGYSFQNIEDSFGYQNAGKGANFPISYRPAFTLIFGEGTNTSETMFRQAQADGWGGNCCGMASTSLLMYSGSSSPSDFGRSSVSTLSVNDSNGSMTVLTFIEAMQIAQYSNVFSKAYNNNKLKKSHFDKGGNMNGLCQGVLSDLNGGKSTIIAIGKNRIGHALLAYRMEKLSATQSRLYVYDCNYPKTDCYIELQTDSQGNYTGWSYNMGGQYGTWGSEVTGCFISYISFNTISYIWENRGQLPNDAQLLSFEGDNLSILNFGGEEIASIENGELVTNRSDIYELPVLTLAWVPVRSIYVPKQFFTVQSMDNSPLSLRVSDQMLGASVSTTAGAVSFSVDSTSWLNTVFVEDAAPDSTYTVTLESSFSGSEYGNVEVSGSGQGETIYISGNSDTLNISNGSIGSLIINGSEKVSCVITASSGVGGTISPSGDTRVQLGEDQTYQITPDAGYEIASVVVDGVSIDPVSEYSFDTVFKDHLIRTTFRKQYEVLSAAVNSSQNTMTVKLSNAGNARVLCALYAEDGQMLTASSVEVTPNIGSLTLPFDTSQRTNGCTIRVMLVDANWRPLCPRFEIRN